MAARRRTTRTRTTRRTTTTRRAPAPRTSRSSAGEIRWHLKPKELGMWKTGRADQLRRRAESLANASGKTVIVISNGRILGRARPD